MKSHAKAFGTIAVIALAFSAEAAVRKVPQQYPTINAAIVASSNGDTIEVQGGPYVEQVLVNKSVKLMGKQSAVIKAPAAMSSPKAIVRVTGAGVSATIQDFTITGPGSGACDSLEYGVRVDSGAYANIRNNDILQIRDTPFSGCQNGVGIQVGRASESTIGGADIRNNNVAGFQKNGITISNSGSMANVDNNNVTGSGPTALIAQNGIQVSSGALASVTHNSISDLIYTPGPDASTGILPFSSGAGSNFDQNDISSADVGIYFFKTTGASAANNKVTQSSYDGIILDTSNNNSLKNNESTNNSQRGPGNGAGFGLYGGASGNSLMGDRATKNIDDGFFADTGTSNNTFDSNTSNDNGGYGFHDKSVGAGTNGTANIYKRNSAKGNTLGDSSPPGLAK